LKELLVVRHAIAFPKDAGRWPDDAKRPLTARGRRRFRDATAGLRRLTAAPDVVLTSPYVRARETADILARRAEWPEARDCPELEPGVHPKEILKRLRATPGARIAVVGHEPHLGHLLALSLAGDENELSVELKKGGVGLISFPDDVRPGAACLLWLATPRLLRAAGE
jgi:phosphohistidine phosphatase